jgi:16S rRNA (guanine966-N2)-methyltransferase
MRIVAGRFRGRVLAAPQGYDVRPTSERTRAALFNILSHNADLPALVGCRFLDGFAGTGAIAIEALSRGADEAILIERDQTALATIAHNLKHCSGAKATVIRGDALNPPRAKDPCALGYLDPPYASDAALPALQALDRAGWWAPGAVVGLEVRRAVRVAPPPGWQLETDRHYGAARLVLLRRAQ